MSRFRERDVHQRIGGDAGKPAEQAVMRWASTLPDWQWSEDGLRQRSTHKRGVSKLHWSLRTIPDFTFTPDSWGGTPVLLEAQGARDDRFVLKWTKLVGLLRWQAFTGHPVLLAVYQQQHERLWVADMDTMLHVVRHPDTEPGVLDLGEKKPKLCWYVPFGLLADHEVADVLGATQTWKRRASDLAEVG